MISHHCLLRAIHCALIPSQIVANFVYGVHHSLAGDGVPTVNWIPASFQACCNAGDAVFIHPGLLFFARAWLGNCAITSGIVEKSMFVLKFSKFVLFTWFASSGNSEFARAGFVLYISLYVSISLFLSPSHHFALSSRIHIS